MDRSEIAGGDPADRRLDGDGKEGSKTTIGTFTGTPSKPSESLVAIKDRIRSALARGESCSLAECKAFVRDVVAASEAQAEEDFHLLHTLSEQVAQTGAEDLLPALTVGAPTMNVDTREVIESILHAQERGGLTRGPPGDHAQSLGGVEASEFGRGINTGAAVERVRRKANQRVVDLIDIVAVCRAERIKLLAELVTASRRRPMSVP